MKPSFWTDARMAALAAPVRLFYIGLWMMADDGGWLRWDVPQIGNELYGYETRKRRERDVTAYGDALEDATRIERMPCGHAFIKTMTPHQRLGGQDKQVHTMEREHQRVCVVPRTPPREPADPRDSPPGKVSVSYGDGRVGVGNGNGKVTRASASEEEDEWQARVAETIAKGQR